MRPSNVTEHAEQHDVVPLPTWLVSTAHTYVRRMSAKEGIRLPYGVQHARQVGSQLTACGLGAFTWELFWDAAFPSGSSSPCHECLRVVAPTQSHSRGWSRTAEG